MRAIVQKWPMVRQLLYAVAGACLLAGTLTGKLSEAQAAQVLEAVGQVLGMAGLILAGVYVPRPDLTDQARPAPAEAERRPAPAVEITVDGIGQVDVARVLEQVVREGRELLDGRRA